MSATKQLFYSAILADGTDSSEALSRPSDRYQRPHLTAHGPLSPLIRGASWKGIDSVGQLDPDQTYPS